MKHYNRLLLIFVASLFIMGFVSQSDATLFLRLTDGTNTVDVEDNKAGDAFITIEGVISWAGIIGDYNITVSTTTSKPLIASGRLDLSVDITSWSLGDGGILTILATDNDFYTPDPVGLYASIGGNTDGEVSMNTYIDSSNSGFGTGTSGPSVGPLTGDPFMDSDQSLLTENVVTPYSLTIETTTNHVAGDHTSFDAQLQVIPEPSFLLLLGTGLASFAGYSKFRHRRRKRA